ncbi:MAG: hypothetical protein Q4D14_04430 [Bacteroidales bacterium]|nr:hypothetical protein [Bacteroidales bacterium]
MLSSESNITLSYPIWIRDFAEGSTSGKGSFMAHDYNEANAWAIINKGISQFMLSTYLPGRNLACFTLFHNGKLIKYGVAQRMEYVMGKVSASGITGNTSKGKLLNDEKVFNVAYDAVTSIARKTAEPMNGLVVTDLKEDANGNLFVTEINIRHVAFTSTFASAGLNFSEYQMLILTGREHEIPECLTIPFSEDNVMLRDIDGLPIYLEHYQPIQQKS